MAGTAADGVTELLDDDAFAAAFDSFVNTDELGKKEEPEAKAEPEAEPEASAEETAPEPEAKVEPEAKAAPVVPPVDKPATAAEIAQAVTDAVKTLAKPAETLPAKAVEEADSPEVIAALEDLEKNWGTHSLAVKTLLQRQEKELTTKFEQKIEQLLEPLKAQLAPVVAASQNLAQEQFNNALLAAHADALDPTLQSDLDKWVASQPEYLQEGYAKVFEHGTAQQVSQVLTQFKTATNRQAATVSTPDPAKEAADAAKAAETAKKLQKMEAPATVRTSITAEPDPTDYDASWDKAAKLAAV